MSHATDHIAQRCADTSALFMESMGQLGIPHGSSGIYADYFSYSARERSSQREETCATSHEYLPLARELVKDPLQTAFTLEHVRTFHDELDFLNDLEFVFRNVKNGFAEGLRRCVDLHRCIPSADVGDKQGRRLQQSHFETRFTAMKLTGEDSVSIALSIEYSSADAYQESGQMEVCHMPLKHFLDKGIFETLFAQGLAELQEARDGQQENTDVADSDGGDSLDGQIDDMLAVQDYMRLTMLVNERAEEIDYARILELAGISIEKVKERATGISMAVEQTEIDDSSAVERSLRDISCEADSIWHAADLCEAVMKAMIRVPRQSAD